MGCCPEFAAGAASKGFPAGKNLEIGRIHFGRFESNHGVPEESGAFFGASSSIKPDRVRGVILAIGKTPLCIKFLQGGTKNAPLPKDIGTRAFLLRGATQIQGRHGLLLSPWARGDCRRRFRPRSAAVLPPGRSGRSQRCVPLCGTGDWSTAAVSARYWVVIALIVCEFCRKVKRWGGWRG